jgi:hypothetical protein
MHQNKHHQREHEAHQQSDPPPHSSYWKFVHRDWRFWLGLVLIFTAMFIYLMTEDLSVRPSPPPSREQSDHSGRN